MSAMRIQATSCRARAQVIKDVKKLTINLHGNVASDMGDLQAKVKEFMKLGGRKNVGDEEEHKLRMGTNRLPPLYHLVLDR